ncbi:hypothetical protein [Nocardioides sp.]|uniref:hypothetical protein n=1 Tax=Nocardioides sp. TaxID=35761 RepID=UPI002639BBC0|nr:hypothetical protein [Nocardioides sp.]
MRDFTLPLSITLALSLLAGLVVLLTRLRLRRTHPGLTLRLHTWLGGIGFVLWLIFLVASSDSDWTSLVGVIGLGCWWVVAITGLFLLARWKPSARGKRAAALSTSADSWSTTPWLSIAAHLSLFIVVGWFTFAYVTSKI